MFVLGGCGDRPAQNLQRLPISFSVREELAKRVFAAVWAQSCRGCFNLVVDFAARAADLVEVEMERESCSVVWKVNWPQVAT